MKKFLWILSAEVVIGAFRVKHIRQGTIKYIEDAIYGRVDSIWRVSSCWEANRKSVILYFVPSVKPMETFYVHGKH